MKVTYNRCVPVRACVQEGVCVPGKPGHACKYVCMCVQGKGKLSLRCIISEQANSLIMLNRNCKCDMYIYV